MPPSLQFQIGGEIDVVLKKLDGPSKLANLEVEKGEINLLGRRPQLRQQFDVLVETGQMEFSTGDLFLKNARIDFKFKGEVAGLDHLFFPMQGARDLKIQSVYEAKQIK